MLRSVSLQKISYSMKEVHNFSAGPSILPREVIVEASKAVRDFQSSGLSILEMSHRSAAIESVMEEARNLVIDLLQVPESHEVLFLTGGASSQFYMVPMNLLPREGTAAYIDTGRWAHKALAEARIYGQVDIIASSADQGYTYIPEPDQFNPGYNYMHITTNNTVAGTQITRIPSVPYPIVADMSSDIFTREIDIHKYGLIYAGAQKNMGPAGTTLVIVKKDILGTTGRDIPTMLDYRTHIKRHSAFNTPPVYAIYVSLLYLRWIKEHGGIPAMQKNSIEKADLLYQEIDRNSIFTGKVREEDRSMMNATFLSINPQAEKEFLRTCSEAGIVGIKGHRSVGGFRASMYNAMPLSSVEYLVELMQKFEKEYS